MGSAKKTTRAGVIAVIACITVMLRLYRVSAPVADWHSFRQADTASVARLYVQHGIDLMHPRYHDLSNIQSGKDNPEGYRMVEFPLYQGVASMLARMFPEPGIDRWLRFVSIASAMGTAVLIVRITETFAPFSIAASSGFVYAVLPYSIFYGRAILPETFAVFWALLSLYMLTWGKGTGMWGRSIVAACAGAIAVLAKPTAGFLLLPAPFLIFRLFGFSYRSCIRIFVYACIGILPVFAWRIWIQQYAEGIPVYEWLLNKDNIRFKGAWFRWIFAERIGNLLLGYWGLVPLGIGIITRLKKPGIWLLHMLGLGSLVYVIVFAAGSVQHDYYQIILLPAVSMYVGAGLVHMVSSVAYARLFRYALSAAVIVFMLTFSWYTIRTFYWVNRPEIILAGEAADRLLPDDAKVIAPYNGDTTFLYQTGRAGWPLGFDIDKKIAMGATHYVTVSPTDADFETKELARKYTVLERNEKYAIIDLTKPVIRSSGQ